jgi:uncharacterized protein
MARLLILVAIAVGLMWWLFGRKRGGPSRPVPPPGAAREGPKAAEMVACAQCGVHLPLEDAVADNGGRVYCGDPHRLAGPR